MYLTVYALITKCHSPASCSLQVFADSSQLRSTVETLLTGMTQKGFLDPETWVAMLRQEQLDAHWWELWRSAADEINMSDRHNVHVSIEEHQAEIPLRLGPAVDTLQFSDDEQLNTPEVQDMARRLEGITLRLGRQTAHRMARALTHFKQEKSVDVFTRGFNLLDVLVSAKLEGSSVCLCTREGELLKAPELEKLLEPRE